MSADDYNLHEPYTVPKAQYGTDVPYVGEDAARTAPHETRASTNHDGLNDGL